MNVFPLDHNMQISAMMNVDNHLHKIILETVQMLSHTCAIQNLNHPYKYNKAQANHPLCRWIRESFSNWCWIVDNMYALQEEWRFRHGHSTSKVHLSIQKFEAMDYPKLPYIELTPMPKSMPTYCIVDNDFNIPIMSYREYYKKEKQHLYKWTKREIPEFLRGSHAF